MSREEQLSQFTAWVRQNITGDEKGHAQIFLDRLFQAFGQPGVLDVGGQTEFRLRKAAEDGGGTAFADLVWKPVVLVEMKRRGTDLQKHFRQAFNYWVRITGGRPRYVVLCNFDEFWVYDFDSDLDAPKDKLALTDLPQRWGPLAFLAPGSPGPKFLYDREAVNRGSKRLGTSTSVYRTAAQPWAAIIVRIRGACRASVTCPLCRVRSLLTAA